MKFGLQHPSFIYNYDSKNVSQIPVSLKNIIKVLKAQVLIYSG
jgi:hypothetical protein